MRGAVQVSLGDPHSGEVELRLPEVVRIKRATPPGFHPTRSRFDCQSGSPGPHFGLISPEWVIIVAE